MPNEWLVYLQKSSLTLNEKMKNPQAVIDALEFFDSQMKNSSSKYMYSSDKSTFIIFFINLNQHIKQLFIHFLKTYR